MSDVQETYERFLKLTGEPGAAATLTLAETIAGRRPEGAMTADEAAAMLGVSPRKVYDLCKEGRLRHQRIGRAVRIRPQDVDEYQADNKQGSPTRTLRCLKRA